MSLQSAQSFWPAVDDMPGVIRGIRNAWEREGIPYTIVGEQRSGQQVEVNLPRDRRGRGLAIACSVLRSAEWKTCVQRTGETWFILAFKAENGKWTALRIDLTVPAIGSAIRFLTSLWRLIFVRRAPCIALVGPDGVGKSTVLSFARQWFEQEAPFISVCFRQWRPWLLPSLARLIGKPEMTAETAAKPRRRPGKFHFLRLVYYYFDFVLGSWWKDRRDSSRAKLIIYDRCSLDMIVDPYRFALASSRGAGLLWRMSPKPNKVILLSDEPEHIYQRKHDIEPHEMQEQLTTWFRLAEAGKVHAIIRVDEGREEIAERVLDLLIDGFVQSNEHDFVTESDDRLQWVGSILTGGSKTAEGSTDGQGFSGSTRNKRSGSEKLAEFMIVPGRSDPRFLIPLGNGAGKAGSLNLYNAQKPLARLSRAVLSAGLRAGIAQPFLRDRVSLRTEVTIQEHLRSLFHGENISVSVSLGSPGPNQKPVLQLMNSQGDILGYAKVGWGKQSINLIENEEAALRMLERETFTGANVPRILHAGRWKNLYVLVQGSVGTPFGASPHNLDERHIRFLIELHRTGPVRQRLPLPDKRLIQKLRSRGFYYYAHLLSRAREFCGERAGGSTVPFGPLHGDFTPWNIWLYCDRLMVFDWEYARHEAPAGWDLFHFLISTAVLIRRQSPGQIYSSMAESGSQNALLKQYFEGLGVAPELVAPVFVSYLADALSQNLLLQGVRAGAKDEALRTAWAALLNLAFYRGAPGI